MLTSEVKTRINACRDILVGKLPDPKSQVLQITNALIYKFMDDQDRTAEKLGGKPSFFKGELKDYAWHRLFDSKLSNQEKADKYIEGIEKLSQAKHLPELFRDIFKEAYVPFRAAGTIVLFIDEINKFNYHHSEELGNAYEYLLSIMGSQGDAGQFRTPRHIIEFLVDAVDPQKGETIYDPAAGTAGFLIAAYKHIIEENKKLSPTDNKKLSENISGIDIDPGMAKVARVNLYLHGFATPHIDEGDTLSDENLWGKKFDVILANPPFMSPKGGIQPHKKFNVKATRSEVLFVDYIAEHLKLKGRAGIIVPEGIIFQAGNVYKELRKMLIEEDYLHTVISLPAGVFQPYSGVKTSILILDRERAKSSDEILFIKIENDGFTIGAQRTERAGDEMPKALEVVSKWREGKKLKSPLASWVSKKEVAESGEYNLSSERYRFFEDKVTIWPVLKFDEVCTLEYGSSLPASVRTDGPYPVMGSNGISGYHDKYLIDGPAIIVGRKGSAGEVTWVEENCFPIDTTYFVKLKKPEKTSLKYLYRILKYLDLTSIRNGAGVPGLNRNDVYSKFKIPLPPIEVQEEIVSELDRYQKIIDGSRQVVENYKPSFKTDPRWKQKPLSEFFELSKSHVDPLKQKGDVNYIGLENIESQTGRIVGEISSLYSDIKSTKNTFKEGDILFGKLRPNLNKVWLANCEGVCSTDILVLKPKENTIPEVYISLILSDSFNQKVLTGLRGAQLPRTNYEHLSSLCLPDIPVDEQIKLKELLVEESVFIKSSRNLISIFEQKIQDKVAEVWGE